MHHTYNIAMQYRVPIEIHNSFNGVIDCTISRYATPLPHAAFLFAKAKMNIIKITNKDQQGVRCANFIFVFQSNVPAQFTEKALERAVSFKAKWTRFTATPGHHAPLGATVSRR